MQFSVGSETVDESAGTFSIPLNATSGASTFASGFESPQGLAFDSGGNLYVANEEINVVSKVTTAARVSSFTQNVSGPAGLAFDSNDLYVANFVGGTVSKERPLGQSAPSPRVSSIPTAWLSTPAIFTSPISAPALKAR